MPPKRKPAKLEGVKARNAAATADHVARIQRANNTSKLDDRFYVLARELADRLGVDAADVIEEFESRAAAREFGGGTTREAAETAAWSDTVERFTKQKEMPRCP